MRLSSARTEDGLCFKNLDTDKDHSWLCHQLHNQFSIFLKGLELSISYERFLGARLNQLLCTVMVPWTNPPRRIITKSTGCWLEFLVSRTGPDREGPFLTPLYPIVASRTVGLFVCFRHSITLTYFNHLHFHQKVDPCWLCQTKGGTWFNPAKSVQGPSESMLGILAKLYSDPLSGAEAMLQTWRIHLKF